MPPAITYPQPRVPPCRACLAAAGDAVYRRCTSTTFSLCAAATPRGGCWLRRFYPPDSDEAHYDLTPGAELAIQWLAGLEQRQFVGAESRLKLVFDLLEQIQQIERGSETDPATRIAELERRRLVLDAEIDEIRAGRMAFLDPTQVRERFLQVRDTARALLADFRQVEQNFRVLDRTVFRVGSEAGSESGVRAGVRIGVRAGVRAQSHGAVLTS